VLFTALLLFYWAARVPAVDLLPLHNDEGLHLTRAVEVWNFHPFWMISDGKIINHWPIALLYPQNAPAFVGRVPTLLTGLLGLAASYEWTRRRFGMLAAALACTLWITSPYLFFYERTALSDSEAGALIMLNLWAVGHLTAAPTPRHAILVGLTFGTAVLFKFTAAPFALLIAALILLERQHPLGLRLRLLIVVAAAAALCFFVPIAYLLLRGQDVFAVAIGWVSPTGAGARAVSDNLARLWDQLTGFGSLGWSALMLVGLLLLPLLARRRGRVLLAAAGLPLAAIVVLGREVLPRHYVVALPLALTLAGAGLGSALQRLPNPVHRRLAAAAIVLLLVGGGLPYALTAYRDPSRLPLPTAVRTQYITEHSGGYGLREAVVALPATVDQPELPVIGSMFPDSCRRANFYALPDAPRLTCVEAPGLVQIAAALDAHGGVYVLTDTAPLIGADILVEAPALDAQAREIARYPRPGESLDSASVILWLLTR
jgi:hypothetical protein